MDQEPDIRVYYDIAGSTMIKRLVPLLLIYRQPKQFKMNYIKV